MPTSSQLLAPARLADQRRPVGFGAFVLAAEPQRARGVLVHVADRQLVQFRRQLVLLDQAAAQPVDEDE